MCFSATASFVTAAALTPIGEAGVAMARRRDPDRWLPLALLPLLFASQQERADDPAPAPTLSTDL